MEFIPALISFDLQKNMALIWVVYSQKKKYGFKNLFLISEQQNGFTVWGEDIPLRKWSIILEKKKKKVTLY